ncbi:CPBP family intramembrane glutamic endopeptidase [Rossellomorea sp. BNER]|uniref:CPBP family intramembrane glutamic endopeptidase n=1 Tax=Rossellomorea sp. BNER TaxID=2962031 RepID=UPI003AF257EE|nr:CPBP family intramembrane metalloprotease [Rossellomorea sp. BNER]
MQFSESNQWGVKEFISLLLLTLLFVPIFIETFVKNHLKQLFDNELYSGTLTGLIMAIIFLTAIYLISLKPYQYSWKKVGVRSFPKRYCWKIILWTIALITASTIIFVLLSFIDIGTENTKTESIKSNLSIFNLFIAIISAGIISPIYEEILYRGFFYKWFRIRCGIFWSVIFSSSIFTIVHIPTYNALPVNFICGVVFALTYEKTKSIIPAIIIHALFNGAAVILTAYS